MMRQLMLFLLALVTTCQITAQSAGESDSLYHPSDSIFTDSIFDVSSAWDYVDRASRNQELWRENSDSVLKAIQRLLDHTREPYDSTINFFKSNDFSSVPVHRGKPEIAETQKVKWINDSTFVLDPQGWNPELYLKEEAQYNYPVDFSSLILSDTLLDENRMLDTTLFIADTTFVTVIDTAVIMELGIKLYSHANGSISPPLSDFSSGRVAQLSADSTLVLYYVPRSTWMADENSPFYILSDQKQLDSLQLAINTLLDYNLERDSTLLFIDDMFGKKTPYWLSGGKDETFRFWVKNFNNDSLTLWIGNPGRGQISLLMEDDVDLKRMVREEISYLPTFLEQPQRALKKMSLLEPEPIYWDYEMANIFGLSQTYLSPNWSQGGESSLTTTIDVIGKATYNNKQTNT
ncbi:MAG: hypothetical protein QNK35_11485, partial [Bacteroides sp.]|nr:hypothetical protein [Bacteroides sp.]